MIERWDDQLPRKDGPRFCAYCGAPRGADARFCANCGRSFDGSVPPAGPAIAAASLQREIPPPLVPKTAAASAALSAPLASSPPQPIDSPTSTSRMLIILGGFLLLAVVGVIALGKLGTFPSSPGVQEPPPAAANIPPVGQAWFGKSFNTSTLEVSGRETSVGVQDGFVMVVHLPRTMDSGQLLIRSYLDGQLWGNQNSQAPGSSDVWGWNLGPLFQAGSWRYEVTDIGGNILASGMITAR